MKTLISCAYNMDNCCVELKFSDGSMIAIDTIAVENEIADNMYQRSELDYLIYNAPCNGVQREHNKKLNNGLPILHKVPPKRDYGRYFCILAEKGGTSHGA